MTTQRKDEPDIPKLQEKRAHGESKGEVSVGVVNLNMRKQVESRMSQKASKSGYDNRFRVITNGHIDFRPTGAS